MTRESIEVKAPGVITRGHYGPGGLAGRAK